MSPNAQGIAALTSEEWVRRERIIRGFEEAWRGGQHPAIEEFLPGDGEGRRNVLIELVHTDLEYRLKGGESARVEEYLERYQEIREDREVELGLITAEMDLRRRREPDLSADEYLARFPVHRAELLSNRRRAIRRGIAPSHLVECPYCREPMAIPEIPGDDPVHCPACAMVLRLDPDHPASWPPPGGTRLGRYELLEEVGGGAFGVVYRARDTELNRIVAVKISRAGRLAEPGEADRFVREGQSAAHLTHPSIVPVHDVGKDGEACYLVCEFVEGTTLADRMACGRLPTRESVELIASVAEALHYAHGRGVVHRDVKPMNILLDRDGRPHLTDFGLAKRDAGEITLTLDGALLGTPAYMAPEQARGESHRVDARSDIYSLGVVLYELLTGERPFRGSRRMVLLQVLEDEPRPPRRLNDKVPRDLETIGLRCLEKEPGRRYADAGALAEDLRRYLAGEPIKARPVGGGERLWRWCRRKPVVAGLATALVLALVGGSAGVTWQLVRVRRERDRAEANRVQLRRALRDYFTLVSEDVIVNEPGLQPLREKLLKAPIAYYQDLLRQRSDDPVLRAEQAHNVFALARLTSLIGERDEALAPYQEAQGLFETIARERPADAGARLDLAQVHLHMGLLHAESGRAKDALRAFMRAEKLFEPLLQLVPDPAHARHGLARALLGIAAIRIAEDVPDQASHPLDRACALLEELTSSDPDNVDVKAALGTARSLVGFQHLGAGRPSEARRSCEVARAIFEPLCRDFPTLTRFRGGMAQSLLGIGIAQGSAGRWSEAVRFIREARDILDPLVLANPADHLLRSLDAEANSRLGRVYAETGKTGEAIPCFERAQQLLEALVHAGAAMFGDRRDLGETFYYLGYLRASKGEREAAQHCFEQARNIFEKPDLSASENPEVRSKRAEVERCLGLLLVEMERPEEAITHLERAQELFKGLIERRPDDHEARSNLARTYHNLGMALQRNGRPDAALEAYSGAIEHQRRACEAAPHLSRYKGFLGDHYAKLGGILKDLGLADEAAVAIREQQRLKPSNLLGILGRSLQPSPAGVDGKAKKD